MTACNATLARLRARRPGRYRRAPAQADPSRTSPDRPHRAARRTHRGTAGGTRGQPRTHSCTEPAARAPAVSDLSVSQALFLTLSEWGLLRRPKPLLARRAGSAVTCRGATKVHAALWTLSRMSRVSGETLPGRSRSGSVVPLGRLSSWRGGWRCGRDAGLGSGLLSGDGECHFDCQAADGAGAD
jgi:hypothetical protein